MLTRVRPYILLFVGLTIVYHANLRPLDSGDTLPASLIPFDLVLDHSITLDRFAPWLRAHVWYTPFVTHMAHDHMFSWYPIGTPLFVAPLYVPVGLFAGKWDAASTVMLARVAEKFAATTVAALSAVLLLLLLKRITTTNWAWCLTLVYALATETWSISSQALWQHGPAELAIIGALLCLDRWASDRNSSRALWLCGMCAAAAFIFRPTAVGIVPAIAISLLLAKARVAEYIRFSAAPFLGGVLLLAYNYYVFGRATGGYGAALLKGSIPVSIAGIFLSPGRGLLIYTPVALFALCAFSSKASMTRQKHGSLFVATVAFLLLDAITIGRSVIWWGGFTWGPRMLTELAPPLVVMMAIGVDEISTPWMRRAFAAALVYSVLVQAVGVFCYPNGHWDSSPVSVDQAPARLWNWRDNPIARTFEGGLYWQPYAVVGAAFMGGASLARRRLQELNVNPYEQAQPASRSPADPGLPCRTCPRR